jgi:hypothetical protein
MRERGMQNPRSTIEEAPEGLRLLGAFRFVLHRWPIVLACALLGAAVASAAGLASPRRYVAEAGVVVDSNVDVVMPSAHRYDIASYLNQQALRLESIAFSDTVWETVSQTILREGYAEDRPAAQALAGSVRLPHPTDGEWRFLAYSRNPALAARLANVWSQAFVDAVDAGVRLAQRDQALREAADAAVKERIRLRGACAGMQAAAAQMQVIASELSGVAPQAVADPGVSLTLAIAVSQAGAVCADLPACASPSTAADLHRLAEAVLTLRQEQAAACERSVESTTTELESMQVERDQLVGLTLGLSAATEVALTRRAAVPDRPETAPAWFLLAGVAAGAAAGAVVETRRGARRRRPG